MARPVADTPAGVGRSLLSRRNAFNFRNVAVRTSPVVPTALIDPDVYHEIVLSLRRSSLLICLGLDETDHCDLRTEVAYRKLPQVGREHLSPENSREPLFSRNAPRRGRCPQVKVVADNPIQGSWVLLLGCLKPLSFKFREKDL